MNRVENWLAELGKPALPVPGFEIEAGTTAVVVTDPQNLDELKPSINHEKTIVCGSHKVFGPENNDLVLQLQKQRTEKVLLAGMSANLCAAVAGIEGLVNFGPGTTGLGS